VEEASHITSFVFPGEIHPEEEAFYAGILPTFGPIKLVSPWFFPFILSGEA